MRFLVLSLIAAATPASPQPAPMTLRQAVARALERYPAVKISEERTAEAAAGIRLARTAFLPRVDVLAQLNRATRNNVYGMLLPQSVIPAISGPPLHSNSPTNVWGSAVGFLVNWEPFDFGLRKAAVAAAETVRRRAETAIARTKLEVATRAADAFLTILAADQTLMAAEAGVARARALDEVVTTLVRVELRPGVDAARTRAEVALAQTQRIQATQAAAVARAALGELLDVPGSGIAVEGSRWLSGPDAEPAPAGPPAHPALDEQKAAIEEARARRKTLERAWFPRFNLQAASYARGTGAHPDFNTGGAASGLGPNIYNWGVGFSVSLPVMDFAAVGARREAELHRMRAEEGRHRELELELAARLEKARAALTGARDVARNTPVQLEAVRAAGEQATARYKAGLGNIVDVVETERLRTQTEIDDRLAKLGVWRARLSVAAAEGSLDVLLDE